MSKPRKLTLRDEIRYFSQERVVPANRQLDKIRSCLSKHDAFATLEHAQRGAAQFSNGDVEAYKCRWCVWWHIGNRTKRFVVKDTPPTA